VQKPEFISKDRDKLLVQKEVYLACISVGVVDTSIVALVDPL